MGIIFSIITDLISPAASFLIGYLFKSTKQFIHKKRKKNILRIESNNRSGKQSGTSDKRVKINAFTANPNIRDCEECVDLGYILEYRAIGELETLLHHHYKDLDFKCFMSPIEKKQLKMALLKENLLVIGGPFHNTVSEMIFELEKEKIGSRFSFLQDASLSYDGKTWTPRRISDGKDDYFEQDYALLINIVNPWNPEKRIIWIMGCRSIGCLGGAKYFRERILDDRKTIKADEYALIIECNGEKESLSSEPILKEYIDLT